MRSLHAQTRAAAARHIALANRVRMNIDLHRPVATSTCGRRGGLRVPEHVLLYYGGLLVRACTGSSTGERLAQMPRREGQRASQQRYDDTNMQSPKHSQETGSSGLWRECEYAGPDDATYCTAKQRPTSVIQFSESAQPDTA